MDEQNIDFYTKEEVNELLSVTDPPAENEMQIDFYTKSEVDYLIEHSGGGGGDVTPTTIIRAADLTGYDGNPDLGNGFTVAVGGGTIAVDSETIDGVTYDGLRISGATTITTNRYFGKISTFEVEFIINSFVSGNNRLLSTNNNFDFSVYTANDDYLRYVADNYHQVLDPAVNRVQYTGGNCIDNSITKASLIGAVTNVKFIDDGTYTTLYVNDVAKVNWRTGYANNSFFLYGQHVGANGEGGADILITKLQWTADGIEYNNQNYVPV